MKIVTIGEGTLINIDNIAYIHSYIFPDSVTIYFDGFTRLTLTKEEAKELFKKMKIKGG